MKYRNSKKPNRGQTLVETALVLPVILLILMGIMDFGMLFNNYLMIGNAARDGARNAAIGISDAAVEEVVDGAASTLDPEKLSFSITPAEVDREKGDEVVVTIGYDYNMITPIIAAIIPGPIHLTARSVMRME